jgi:hypothetical protein
VVLTQLARQDRLAHKEYRAQADSLDHRAFLAPLEHKAFLAPLEHKAFLAPLEHKAFLAPLEHKAFLAQLEQKATLVQLELKVFKAQPETTGQQDRKAIQDQLVRQERRPLRIWGIVYIKNEKDRGCMNSYYNDGNTNYRSM